MLYDSVHQRTPETGGGDTRHGPLGESLLANK